MNLLSQHFSAISILCMLVMQRHENLGYTAQPLSGALGAGLSHIVERVLSSQGFAAVCGAAARSAKLLS